MVSVNAFAVIAVSFGNMFGFALTLVVFVLSAGPGLARSLRLTPAESKQYDARLLLEQGTSA